MLWEEGSERFEIFEIRFGGGRLGIEAEVGAWTLLFSLIVLLPSSPTMSAYAMQWMKKQTEGTVIRLLGSVLKLCHFIILNVAFGELQLKWGRDLLAAV